MARSTEIYLCFDLGGTKLFAALINSQGKILAQNAKRIDQSRGFKGLLEDFRELGKSFPGAKYKSVSVASAGPLHSGRGVLLDPTNFFTGNKSWGIVPLVASLKKIFKKPVLLENDAAAAVLAEGWKGGHGRTKNIVAITLGTGVGIGALAEGQLVRAGRGLHPEASHMPMNVEDKLYPCGCGAYGCIEAYLAGSHFARHLSLKVGRNLSGQDCLALAQTGDPATLQAFQAYGQRLAVAIRSLCVVFAPEVVVISGGFAKAGPFFLPTVERHLPMVMSRYREGIDLVPKVKISKLGDSAGVLGAAYVAVSEKIKKGR